jgi:hypothetical protein
MANRLVQMVVHAVKRKTVNGHVVLYQMLYVVKIMNIVALMDTPVMCQQEHAHDKILKASRFS